MSDIPEDPFIAPHDSSEEINLEKTKHARGRPKNVVWQFFEHNSLKYPGHFDAKCKFCDHYWKMGIVKKLQVHLARECENVDIDIKNKYMHIVAKRDGLNNTEEIEITNTDNERDKNNELLPEQVALIDHSVLKAFVMCGIPFRVIENPYYVNMLKNLHPNYNSPSQERLSNNLLSEECIRIEIKINNHLEKSKNLTLALDGWTSPNGCSIYNFMIIADNKEYLYSLRDLSSVNHTAKVLEEEIDHVLIAIGPKKISAVISDNAIAIANARKYPYILNIRCVTHFVNLITKDILDYKFANKIIRYCNIISHFFKLSHKAGATLKQFIEEYKIEGGGLHTYTPTRWTSMFDTVEAIFRLKRPLEKV